MEKQETAAPSGQEKPSPNPPAADETAVAEYLDVVKSEYEIERNKKQSFENRAGFVTALLGAVCVFLFERVQLKEIFPLINVPLTFLNLVTIASGLAVYGSLLFTMIMIIQTITVKQHYNFEVKSIDESLLRESRPLGLRRIIMAYKDIVVQHRGLNEERAKAFRRSLYGVFATFIFAVVYTTLT